jgi:hypothetical protein
MAQFGMTAEEKEITVLWQSRVRSYHPFADGSGTMKCRVEIAGSERQLIVSHHIIEILELLDGKRTVADVAKLLTSKIYSISENELTTILTSVLIPQGLVTDSTDSLTYQESEVSRRRRRLDFIFRFPLFSQQRIDPIARRLQCMFHPLVVSAALLATLLSHIAFYIQPHSGREASTNAASLLIVYCIAVLVTCWHELGHISACKRYGGEHGEIGFCLYLAFPALYANLSRSWSLPRKQRAVIDVGGLYFQLLLVVPLTIVHSLTHFPSIASVIYAIDIMTVMSLNPFLRYDGYWILVDASGIVNLQRRALDLITCFFTLSKHEVKEKIYEITKTPLQRAILIAYTCLTGIASVVLLPIVIVNIPRRIGAIVGASGDLSVAAHNGGAILIVEIIKIIALCMFVPITVRLLVRLVQRIPWKHVASTRSNIRFIALSSSMLYVAALLQVTIHECGHAIAGWLMGANVQLVQICAAGGRTIALFPMDGPSWKPGLMQVGGIGLSLAVSIAILMMSKKEHATSYIRWFAFYLGTMISLSVALSSGVVIPNASQGEVSSGIIALGLHGIARQMIQICCTVIGFTLAGAFYIRLINYSCKFDAAGSSVRTGVAIRCWAIPLLSTAALQILLGWHTSSKGELYATSVIALILAGAGTLLAFFPEPRGTQTCSDPTTSNIFIMTTIACFLILAQIFIFGVDRERPRGIFIYRHPPENAVAALNMLIHIDGAHHATITMAMRPFVSSQAFLWIKVRSNEPINWMPYDVFAMKTTTAIFPTGHYKLLRHYNAPDRNFFVDGATFKGARVVEAEETWDEDTNDEGPIHGIHLVDTWKQNRVGYLDMIGIETGTALEITGIHTMPEQFHNPYLLSPHSVMWVNRDFRSAYETYDVTVKGELSEHK